MGPPTPDQRDALDTLRLAETPEGIALALRPAGLPARTLAYLVDFGIRGVVYIVVLLGTGAFGGLGMAMLLIGMFLLEWLYPVAFELSRAAATPGKRLLGLRVVMESGLPVTPAASLLRNLLRAADFMPGMYAFGIAAMLMRPDSQRLGDMAAGTLVVHGEAAPLHAPMPPAAPRPPSRPLDMREQAAILAWAGRAARLTPERLEELAALAAPAHGGGTPATPQLLGVAHWLAGHRQPPAP